MNASFNPFGPKPPLVPNPKLRFLDQCRAALRFKQMSHRTEETYVDWIRRFIVWSGKRHRAGSVPRKRLTPSTFRLLALTLGPF